MNTNSNKFGHIFVNTGGRRESHRPSSDRYGRRKRASSELGLALSPIERALMGTIGRPWV